MTALISEQTLGQLENGRIVKRFLLKNTKGAQATFLNLGASWVSYKRPEDQESLVLGCESLEAFQNQGAYLGATVGRFANRIKDARFPLAGQTVQLEANEGSNQLHGGSQGFSNQVFDSHIKLDENNIPTLTFQYHCAAGQSGYPGNMIVTVVVQLMDDNRVRFEYSGTSDALSILNMTCHAYFNLDGQYRGTLEDHEFKLDADSFVQSDETLIPTGELMSVENTALDLRQWKNIQAELSSLNDPYLTLSNGYDHCYCYPTDKKLRTVASAKSSQSNTLLECRSDLPGIQLYSGNFIQDVAFDGQNHFEKHGAFCFEPGFWPDSPNHAHFPDCTIDVDKPYSAIIEYSFKTLD